MIKIRHIALLSFMIACIPKQAFSDQPQVITTLLPADSVMQLPIDTTVQLIYFLDYSHRPQLIPATNTLIVKVSMKALHQNYKNMDALVHSISRYALRNSQQHFVIDLLEALNEHDTKLTKAQHIFILKKLGFFYNKIGEFGTSLEIFEEGLQKAIDANLPQLEMDFYHHLSHEYDYLSLIDTNYLYEVERLQKKCYEHAIESKDSTVLAFELINMRSRGYSVSDLSALISQSIDMLDPEDFEYHDIIEILLCQYLEALYNNQHYHSYVSQTHQIYDSLKYEPNVLMTARLSQCYIKLGDWTNARKYAEITEDLFSQNLDNDNQRLVLIFIPEVFEQLGMLEPAYEYALLRNKAMQKQVTNKRRINKERERFEREIDQEIAKTEVQQSRNRYLATGLILLAVILVVIIYSIRALRSKNLVINDTLQELEIVNQNLNQANKDLESFAYASAHDIKNPLSTISGFIQLIKIDQDSKISDDSHHNIKSIDSSIQEANSLISSILRYAKIGSQNLQSQEISLSDKIVSVKTLLHQQIHKTQAKIKINHPLPTINGEPDLIQQVILNLMSNALKYHHPDEPPLINISTTQDSQNIHLHISDNGIGIPEENFNKIFHLFGRAKNSQSYEGVGVGLALCLKIAKLHQGHISVKNNPDQGATFTLTLPHPNQQYKASSYLIYKSK